jgi:phytoene synthase
MTNDPHKTEHFINRMDITKIDKHPNILIAASFWEDDRYHAARVCYRFMREIDDMVDDRKSSEKRISCMEKQLLSEKVNNWINCLDKNTGNDPFLQELINTVDTYKIPLLYFHNFAEAMQYDINHNSFPTFQSFIEYAEGASVAPASIFVHLCCLQKENGSYEVPPIDILEVARPCAIFSYLVHVIRDFQKDQKENLNYFALDILEQYNLRPEDLKEIAMDNRIPLEFRNVMRFYKDKAEEYRQESIQQIDRLQSIVNGRYLVSLNIIYQLYLSVYNRIDIEKGTFTTEELTPSNEEIAAMVMDV